MGLPRAEGSALVRREGPFGTRVLLVASMFPVRILSCSEVLMRLPRLAFASSLLIGAALILGCGDTKPTGPLPTGGGSTEPVPKTKKPGIPQPPQPPSPPP